MKEREITDRGMGRGWVTAEWEKTAAVSDSSSEDELSLPRADGPLLGKRRNARKGGVSLPANDRAEV